MYDASSQASSDDSVQWYRSALENLSTPVPTIVVATKQDLTLQTGSVSPPPFVSEQNLPFIEMSSLSGVGSAELIMLIVKEFFKSQPEELLIGDSKDKQSGGCVIL